MAAKKCLIVDVMHESIFSLLQGIGWESDYRPDVTRADIKVLHAGYDGIIVRSKTTVDRDLLGENPTVRFIARAGAGLDNLDLDYLNEKKIFVLHAAEGNRDAVGEFTVGLLLALLRNISVSDSQVKTYMWEREQNRGMEIMGKTIGIIGYGNMGRAFAERLSGFGCKILVYDKYKKGFGNNFCQEVGMDRIFEETDILSLHIPLTGETRKMVDIAYFNRFQKDIVIVNTARGEIVGLDDLAQAIRNGKVKGAALDVLENEKLNQFTQTQQQSFNYLKSQSNVIFTPHIAGWTYESHVKINVALVEKIKDLKV
jgi:D-3-phosphoglycerate dehydrogenase / 2-oxoglutarate reductase